MEGQLIRKSFSDPTSYRHSFQNHVIKKGQKILKTNAFLSGLDKIMRMKEFRNFYDTYFKSFEEMETILLYMKLYETLQKEYEETYHQEIPRELMAYTLYEIFTKNELRRLTMESFQDFCDKYKETRQNGYILNLFDKIDNLDEMIKNGEMENELKDA